MRIALTALIAFAAGVMLMLLLSGHLIREPTSAALSAIQTGANPANQASAAKASSATTDADDETDDDNWPKNAPTPEQVFDTQPTLMKTALSQLTPRVPNKSNVYVIAFAGDGGEDVFRNEAEYASQLFTTRFGPTTHALVLENNPATLQTYPLADWSNLEAALDGVASQMNPQQDILLLYMTSHGDEEHNLLVDMDPLPLDQIGNADLASIFKKHPFKWKVVVVNACYSGGFVPNLRAPGTLVITAARTDRSSFGCGSDSDATYFGKAWLVNALNQTDDFVDAFQRAKTQIAQWETQDKLTASEPQIDVGDGIADQLAAWRKNVVVGPTVPFVPPAPAAPSTSATAAN